MSIWYQSRINMWSDLAQSSKDLNVANLTGFLRVVQPWAIQYLTQFSHLTLYKMSYLSNMTNTKCDTQNVTHIMWPRWGKHKRLKAQKIKNKKKKWIENIHRPSYFELPQYSKHTTSLCRETYLFGVECIDCIIWLNFRAKSSQKRQSNNHNFLSKFLECHVTKSFNIHIGNWFNFRVILYIYIDWTFAPKCWKMKPECF